MLFVIYWTSGKKFAESEITESFVITQSGFLDMISWFILLLSLYTGHNKPVTDQNRRAFKNMYELLNLRALKFSNANKIHIFQCMDKIFCVEFQRVPLKFHTKYHTHKLKDTIFIQWWNLESS